MGSYLLTRGFIMEFVKNLITDKKRLNILNGFVIGIVAISFLIFFPVLESNLMENAKQNEIDTTKIYVANFERAFSEQLTFLELMGDELGKMKPGSVEEIREALSEIKDPSCFDLLRFAQDDGVAYGTEEELDRFVTGQQNYVKSLAGEQVVSDELISVKDQFSAIIFSVPVYFDGEVGGVLFGYIYGDGFSRIIDAMSPDGRSLLVVDGAMEILGKSDAQALNNIRYQFDYYLRQFRYTDKVAYRDIVGEMKAGEEKLYEIEYGGESCFMTLVPLNIHNWYLVQLTQTAEATLFERSVMQKAGLFAIFATVMIGLLLCFADVAILNSFELIELNAKYSLLDNESKSVTFSCNPNSRAVELNGAVAQTFGKEIAEAGTVNLVTLLDYLHENDQGLSKAIAKAGGEGKDKFETDVQIRREDGGYGWYKVEAIFLRDKRGKIQTVVGSLKNTEDQIEKEHDLKSKAERDLLTGLLNKITMEQSVTEMIKKKPYGKYAFYIIDLDNFKAVNDNLGHATGDKVLTDVSAKLNLQFNEFDFIGRLGGDEFAVMLVIPENMSNYASGLIEVKAKNLCDNLKETYSDGTTDITVTASIGIAAYPSQGESFEELYKHADLALYHSKNTGKNRYTFYSTEFEKE
ncbi:MAG: diguanylate cyclase [Lachnospiraceae bacterium]|nr:diguanylate cyclase [Lachnospiraceae bacterium]